jgi:glucose/arabinose dehydrogenase
VAPAQNLGPHVAPLGMRFYTGTQFPAEYRQQVFIAEHGSWNRSRKIGYRVMLVRLDEQGRATKYETFAEGWLQGESAWGRPADVIVAQDGSLLVSDDLAGAIYRIRYAR